ncbi:substrate-binding periplasmic protein [Aliikangiella maris]|uniref:Transporter substrate-binding domain-containing protein n=2 Tax=Aliikangiella maris TaxID=3162458 RepID=A0ABV3MP35_9GAMM
MKILSKFGLLSCMVFLLVNCSEPSNTENTPPQEVTTPPMANQPPPKPENQCQLTMGWDPWEPYQYLTPEDQVRGLEIDLVKAMATIAGCELTFVQKNWMNLLDDVRNGNIDLLGGASKTSAREKFAFFSDYYRQESFVLYVRKNEANKYTQSKLTDILTGEFKLGVTENYIYGEMVTNLQDSEPFKDKFVSVPTSEVNFYNLIQNQIDGFLEDPFVAGYTIKRKGLQGQIEAHPIKIHSGDVALMFSKKSVKPETVVAFNRALHQLQQSGDYQKILDKYRF